MFKYIKVIFRLAFKIAHCYFSWIYKYYHHKEKYPLEVRFAKVQKICREIIVGFDMLGFADSTKEFHLAHNNGKNNLLICNHQSFIDPLFIIAKSDRPVTFVAKIESKNMPFVGKVVDILDGFFLDRSNLKEELKTFMKVQERLKDVTHPLDILVFAEGTRNKDPEHNDVKEFHGGSFRCAYKSQANIVLMSIYGTYRATDKKYKTKYNPIQMKYIRFLPYEEYKDINSNDLAVTTHQEVNETYIKLRENDYNLLKIINKKILD